MRSIVFTLVALCAATHDEVTHVGCWTTVTGVIDPPFANGASFWFGTRGDLVTVTTCSPFTTVNTRIRVYNRSDYLPQSLIAQSDNGASCMLSGNITGSSISVVPPTDVPFLYVLVDRVGSDESRGIFEFSTECYQGSQTINGPPSTTGTEQPGQTDPPTGSDDCSQEVELAGWRMAARVGEILAQADANVTAVLAAANANITRIRARAQAEINALVEYTSGLPPVW